MNFMKNIKIVAENISIAFSPRKFIFKDISFELENGEVLAICGKNGSGKSTLLKIILGIIKQTKGNVYWKDEGQIIDKDDYNNYCGFSAPYLNLYEEFTPIELMKVISQLRSIIIEDVYQKELLSQFLLFEHRYKPIRNFSSGMKQRMKLLIAKLAKPPVLILDEPSSNLDSIGFEIVRDLILEHKKEGGLVLLASNEEKEIELSEKSITII